MVPVKFTQPLVHPPNITLVHPPNITVHPSPHRPFGNSRSTPPPLLNPHVTSASYHNQSVRKLCLFTSHYLPVSPSCYPTSNIHIHIEAQFFLLTINISSAVRSCVTILFIFFFNLNTHTSFQTISWFNRLAV